MAAVLTAQGLSKRFGSVTAVDDLSFEVEEGTVTGFLGPNGAGKTTTLRMLLGLVTPTSGTAMVDGRLYRQLDQPARHVGVVLEAAGFHPGRRARNHLRTLAAAARLDESRADEVLTQLGLDDAARRRAGGFSLGMRQRLALAGALLGDPRILILDEPANGLDPEGMHWLRQFLRQFAAAGGTVLVSSHVLSEVAQTVDQVVIIARGRLVTQAPLSALTRRAEAAVRVRTPEADVLRERLAARGVRAEVQDGVVVASGVTTEAVGTVAAEGGIVVHEMGLEATNLEDVFLELVSPAGTREATP